MSRRVKTEITDQVPLIIFIIYTSKYDVWMSGVRLSTECCWIIVSCAHALQVLGNLTFDAKTQKIIGGTLSVILVSSLVSRHM